MSVEDRVVIRLNGEETKICESYEVHMGVLTQPSRFAVRIGHSGTIKELLKKYPNGTKFELLVHDGTEYRKQFTGAVSARSAGGYASTLTLKGRDLLADLMNNHALADKSYAGATYFDLVSSVFSDAGVKDITLFDESDNDRKAKTGSNAANGSEKVKADIKKKGKKTIVHPPTIKAGEEYFHFLKDHLDRVGLFLFSAADGAIVLSSPDREQPPLYQVINKRNGDASVPGTVVDFQFDDDATDRYTECVVYGRGGGRNVGRTKTRGTIPDEEMVATGFLSRLVKIDHRVSSPDEAEFYARRAISESRRRGWRLEYTLAGHTTASRFGGRRIVWARDTVVNVRDEELGFEEDMFLESVTLLGTKDSTQTVVRCMRLEDLRFLDDPAKDLS